MNKTEVDIEIVARIIIPVSNIIANQKTLQRFDFPAKSANQSSHNRPESKRSVEPDGRGDISLISCCAKSNVKKRIKVAVGISNAARLPRQSHQMGSTIFDSELPSKSQSLASGLYPQSTTRTISWPYILLLFLILLLLSLNTICLCISEWAEDTTLTHILTEDKLKKVSSGPSDIRKIRSIENEVDNQISVQTRQGLFKGLILPDRFDEMNKPMDVGETTETQVVGFLGIRYASAPIRRLRFMPPTAYNYAPNQTHNMNKFGPICKQRLPLDTAVLTHLLEANLIPQDTLNNILRLESSTDKSMQLEDDYRNSEAMSISETKLQELQLLLTKSLISREAFAHLRPLIKRLSRLEQSEDCLNLNIYSPSSAIASNGKRTSLEGAVVPKLPVLVIIHGSSFDYGAGLLINGARLVRRHQGIIVITFNFRLNILGFPPKMVGASRGNLGLMDQVAALHWVRDNVAAFGGSPSNITLMGTKKGAIFVSLLMLSPLAKGLFQRSIMEDGSVLTPLVANHIISTSTAAPLVATAKQQFNFPPAIQHVRLLARLCDCPLLPFASGRTNSSSSSSSVSRIAGSSSQQQQQQQLAFAEEAKLNALTFECLRQKPVEQILQPIPLNLLQANQLNGEIDLSDVANKLLLTHSQLATNEFVSSSISNYTSTAANPIITRQMVSKLLALAVKEKLMSLTAEAEDKVQSRNSSDLFSAIFEPPSETIQLPFLPVIDGTILPDEDLPSLMLKQSSSFAQRDLLIGLKRPSFGAPLTTIVSPKLDDGFSTPESDLQATTSHFHQLPIFDHQASEHFTSDIQKRGIASDRAFELVSVFVRSFYRYHNQEITNSIISNYLMNNGNSPKRIKKVRLKQQQLNKPAAFNAVVIDQSTQDNVEDTLITEQKLQTLESILELIQDSLISVPVLKTALIHATKQLEPLVDVFVGQQFEKWKQQHQHNQHQLLIQDSNESTLLDHKTLLDSFVSFAKSLFEDPQWPLEIRQHNSNITTVIQPKATYLFQLDGALHLQDLQLHIKRLEFNRQLGWRTLYNSMRTLLTRLLAIGYQDHLTFGCLLENLIDVKKDENELAFRYINRLCERLEPILINFVTSGNVNQPIKHSEDPNIGARLAQFENKCLGLRAGDSESVQIAAQTSTEELDGDCRRELDSITLDYLFEEQQAGQEVERWPTFNLFSQQVAILPTIGSNTWRLNRISDDSDQFDNGPSLISRVTFWSNFIPALNCSKTLPITPMSSPSNTDLNSSTLLNLNLAFSCQQSSVKTPLDSIHSHIMYIGKQLKNMISRWISIEIAKSSTVQQSHHNLRMVNLSQSELEQHQQAELHDEQQQQQQQQQNKIVTTLNESQLFSRFSQRNNDQTSLSGDTVQVKRAGLILVICGLVICFTIASGACAVMWQRKSPMRNLNQNQSLPEQQILQQQQQSFSQIESSPEQVSTSFLENETDFTRSLSQQQPVTDIQTTTPILLIDSVADFKESVTNLHRSSSSYACIMNQASSIDYQDRERSQRQTPMVTVGLCRSHSSLANHAVFSPSEMNQDGERILHHFVNNDDQLIATMNATEPIMVPLLNTPSSHFESAHTTNHEEVTHLPSCLVHPAHSTNYVGSSGDTQSSTLGSSNMKKRVKISDPLGTSRRESSRSNSRNSHMQSSNRIQSVEHNQRQQQDSSNQLSYCLVHGRNIPHSSSAMELEPTGYYTLDNSYINPDDVQIWPFLNP